MRRCSPRPLSGGWAGRFRGSAITILHSAGLAGHSMNTPTPSVLIKISPYRFLLAALLGLIALQPAHAIVVNSRFAGATTNAEAASFPQLMASPFSNVVRLFINNSGVCTGTLISAATILTANHCTSGTAENLIIVTFDQNGDGLVDVGIDQVNDIISKFEAPDVLCNPNFVDGTDPAVLELAGPLPSWAMSCQQLWDGDVLGSTVTMVGMVIRE